jgi:hypothetical protein
VRNSTSQKQRQQKEKNSTSTTEKAFSPSFKINDVVTVVLSHYQQIQNGDRGVITDILPEGYGVEFFFKSYRLADVIETLKKNHKVTIFFKEDEIKLASVYKNGTTSN